MMNKSQKSLNRKSSGRNRASQHSSGGKHASLIPFLEPSFEKKEEDFVIINDNVDPTAMSNNAKLPKHELGYPLAVNSLLNNISCKDLAVQMAGGFPIRKHGTAYITYKVDKLQGLNFNLQTKPKRKYVDLNEGKLRIFQISQNVNLNNMLDGTKYVEGGFIDEDDLKLETMYTIQRIRAIRYISPSAKKFVVVFLKHKSSKKAGMQGIGSTLRKMKKLQSNPNIFNMSMSRVKNKNKSNGSPKQSSSNSITSSQTQSQKQSPEVSRINRKKEKGKGGNTLFRMKFGGSKTLRKALGGGNKKKNGKHISAEGRSTAALSIVPPSEISFGNFSINSMASYRTNKIDSELQEYDDHKPAPMAKSVSMNNIRAKNKHRNINNLTNLPPKFGTQVSLMSNDTNANPQHNKEGSFEQYGNLSDGENDEENYDTDVGHSTPAKSFKIKGVQVEVQTNKKRQDELQIWEDLEEEAVEFSFETPDVCRDWVKNLIIDIENQAKMFRAFADILEKTNNGHRDTFKSFTSQDTQAPSAEKLEENDKKIEIMLRYSVDLITAAQGVFSPTVWRYREKLARFLETRGKIDECRIWYELSEKLRSKSGHAESDKDLDSKRETFFSNLSPKTSTLSFQTLNFDKGTEISRENKISLDESPMLKKQHKKSLKDLKPKDRDEAFYRLVLFFEQYAHGRYVHAAEDDARELFQKYTTLNQISKRVYAEYGRVPDGFEYYLVSTPDSPFEEVQKEAQEIKRRGESRMTASSVDSI